MPVAVEADQLAEPEAEMVPVRLREVVELVLVEIHAARGDLVQQRLPQVGARAVDERHLAPAAAAERVAEPRRELQAAGAAADDDDAVELLAWIGSPGLTFDLAPLGCMLRLSLGAREASNGSASAVMGSAGLGSEVIGMALVSSSGHLDLGSKHAVPSAQVPAR